MSIKSHRFFHAVSYVLRKGAVASGIELKVLLGHGIHILGINRILSCLPYNIYQFIHAHYDTRTRLWNPVVQELAWMRALLPLAVAECDCPWCVTYYAYDASLGGFGICRASTDLGAVALAGRMRERYRYRGAHRTDVAPRAHLSPERIASDLLDEDLEVYVMVLEVYVMVTNSYVLPLQRAGGDKHVANNPECQMKVERAAGANTWQTIPKFR